jgi:hypothetical protein
MYFKTIWSDKSVYSIWAWLNWKKVIEKKFSTFSKRNKKDLISPLELVLTYFFIKYILLIIVY